MSIYNLRNEPAYSLWNTDPSYSQNPHILKWWESKHDQIMAEQIALWQWIWYSKIADEIIKVTSIITIEAWKKSDPLCSKYAWYNILMYFAVARAEQLGLTKVIRNPAKKNCPLCGHSFIEDSLPIPLVERLGIDNLDFCAPCLRDTVLQGSGNNALSKEEIYDYLRNLATLIERVPTQNFGEGLNDLLDISPKDRVDLLKLLLRKPSAKRVKEVLGSWLNALIQAGVLEDGTRKASRGIQSVARDGHVCLSLGEKTIDDFLYSRSIIHDKEPRYPEGNFRGDFRVNDVIIEYFGLVGNPEYDAKSKEKTRICKKHGISLITIYPEDVISLKKLEIKLSRCL